MITQLDTDDYGDYYHRIEGPYNNVYEQALGTPEFSKLVWYRKTNDIDPYNAPFVKVFTNPTTGLRPATIYGCSCPSYSSAQLRMPQTTQGPQQRKINRQRNYPLPTALGRKDYESIGYGRDPRFGLCRRSPRRDVEDGRCELCGTEARR